MTDLSFLNAKPADKPVTVRDGHFLAGGERVRFWGAILIGADCFPPKEEAPQLARRLASRGFNMVRMHLFDGYYAPQGIFDPEHKGELRMVPEQLDRLDFLIAELKKAGIYVELPVHGWHWRNIQAASQFPGVDMQKLSAFGSGVPLWNEVFIEGEKRFAKEFIGHVNPYTGKAYPEEPAVACVEIINENGILCAWRGGYLRKAWPAELVADFQKAWTGFLKGRYKTHERLRKAWSASEVRADKAEMLKDGSFTEGMAKWYLQVVKPSTCTTELQPHGGPTGQPCAILNSERTSEPMAFVILQQAGLSIQKDCQYQLTFLARAEEPAQLNVGISLNHPPWNGVGLSTRVEVSREWQEVSLPFTGTQDEAAAKVMITPLEGKSQISLTGLSLRKADVVGLPDGESLETGTIRMPLTPGDCVRRTPAFGTDFVDFLFETDRLYFAGMYDYLKNTLGCRQPIKATQVDQYSSFFSQAACDFVDSHGYYQHPHFPRKPWDAKDWTVANTPMVNHGGETVVELAGRRVRGKPYHISEYCHPAPSTYCAEQMPTVAAFGALQDWDGIVFHSWRELMYDWKRREIVKLPADRMDSFFNIARHPVKLVTVPFGTLAFRRGDVAPARMETAIGVTLEQEKRWLIEQQRRSDGWRGFAAAATLGITWRDAFTHRLALNLGSEAKSPFLPEDVTHATSDTGELLYDLSNAEAGALTVNTPRAKAVIGFGAGKTFDLGDVTLLPGPSRQGGFSVITASVVRGESFRSPGAAILVTATGYIENQGMGWNEKKTSVGDQWGAGPVLCEGIPFELVIQTKKASAWALDAQGRRSASLPATADIHGVKFTFGPQHKTLWYEIAAE